MYIYTHTCTDTHRHAHILTHLNKQTYMYVPVGLNFCPQISPKAAFPVSLCRQISWWVRWPSHLKHPDGSGFQAVRSLIKWLWGSVSSQGQGRAGQGGGVEGLLEQPAWKQGWNSVLPVVERLVERAVNKGGIGFRFQEHLKIYLTQLLAFWI